MKIHALGTHSDWVYNGGAWGRAGHQRIADLTYAAGIRRLYWRTHNGGLACYPSKICGVQDGELYRDPNFKGFGALPASHFAYAGQIDYREWDQVADMAEIGTRVGLETCHWITIFEDDHGGHLPSDFIRKHSEFRCMLRNGEAVPGCLDFGFPEVRDYKLAVLDEVLERPAKRVLLDFVRRNGRPSADADGNYRYGYSPELVAAFHRETGLDAADLKPGTAEWEAWLDFHARPLTEFIRAASERIRAKGLGVDILVWAVDTRAWKALDLETVVREGLVDNVLTGTLRYGFSPAEARRQVTVIREQLGADNAVPILPGLFAYHQIPPLSVDEFFSAAEAEGCSEVVLHEANHVIECPISDRLRAWFFGLPHSNREVESQAAGVPIRHEGFIRCHANERLEPDQKTAFTVSHTAEELVVTVTCEEREPANLLPVPGLGTDNFNANEMRARVFWNPFESVHLFLDPVHAHEDYCHFVLDPSGARQSERRLDERWEPDWNREVIVGETSWTARFCLPWSTLGICPQPGRVLGFQILRIQNSPSELSAWFCTTGRRINPLDFGHLLIS
jgi:hypothetical protein